ncbi:hypothetical protein, partial [Lactobacillus sp.]|uniref:hypothetical protein n=1 Tax=Lactobacillus sp. TaxID=1591 RepID=UPI0025E3F82F
TSITDSYGKECGKVTVIRKGESLLIRSSGIQSFDVKLYRACKEIATYRNLTGESRLPIEW